MPARAKVPVERPLSPHLQIFRPIITMVMSILHRITGVAIYLGTILFVWWLAAAAAGPDHYAVFAGFIGSWFGRLVLFGLSWALLHHLLGGIRHLVWDAGYGFDLPAANAMSWGTIIGSVTLTLVVWIVGYLVM